jgi:FKBP-type peptidyl-prolyl cis-trans isomerase FkpA
MLLKNAFFIVSAFFLLVLYSCEKPVEYDDAVRDAQLAKDLDSIDAFVARKKLTVLKDPSGIAYKIINRGSGTVVLGDLDTVLVTYTGRLLNDSLVEVSADTTSLAIGSLPPGWKIGLKIVPPGSPNNIQAGGTIQLIVPSTLAYINRPVYTTINHALGIYVGIIPPNSVLNYSITILRIDKEIKKDK